MILRELFSKIVVDVAAAIKNVNRFDASLDGAAEGLDKTEKQSKELGTELDKSAKKGKKFGDIIADSFKRGGRAAFNARGKIRDAGIGIGKAFLAASAGAGALTLAAGALTVAWADNSLELDNLSKKYRLSTDDIQAFTGAMSQIGLEAEDGLEAIKELRIRLGEAKREGTSPLKEALIDLGISFDAFDALPLLDQFGMLADRLLEVEDATRLTALANDIAGDDLIKLLPLLELQSEGLEKLFKSSKKLNLVQSKESIKAGAALAKTWKTLLAIFKSVRGLIASKLEPTFSALIGTTLEWVQANRTLISGKVVEFVERLVNVTADFLPVAVKFADSMLTIIEQLGGVDGAITAVIGTMAAWKISTVALLGPAGPWIAGLIAVGALLKIFGDRVDAADAKITRLGKKRKLGLTFRRRGTFTTEELEAAGAPGAEVLRLEAERAAKIAERKALGIDPDIGKARAELRARLEEQTPAGGFSRDIGIKSQITAQLNAAKKLEIAIDSYEKLINEQLSLIRDQQANEKATERRARALVSSESIEDDRKLRKRVRELTELFRREKATAADKAELRFLVVTLGTDAPEGLLDEGKGGGKGKGKKDKPSETTIEELIGLGPKGIKTISDLIPAGQGTTINNFSFSTTVQPARVDIVVNSPEGTSAAAIGREVSEQFAQVQSDVIFAEQRELTGQLQG